MDLQDRIIRRHRLECDICMPSIAGELAWFGQWVDGWLGAFLLLHAADYGDLIAKLAACFCDGMDVEA